ncbi:hypothetical protein G6O69_31770 [Pseudenhygromyxa sp. WMMC2535]|uniref:DUF3592 domain-containing protein n=1 Tax=Pseudenhygromyxa sp. WMMC2535 TaxID=2712867 RepID=UPI0015555BEA|nr:DUF3592 domain-containing protein [Pseudenhygromyxa sp. WMMC2535]NVB42445.1 hypothetical protein [Pseudenhygromyxa sp. WMMC2535]
MSDATLLILGGLELAGIVGVFALSRRNKARRAAGQPRPPVPVRVASAVLLLAVVIGFPAVIVLAFINPSLQTERLHERLVEEGVPATATITRVQETGTVVNKQPEVQVSVEVQPEDGPAFASQSTWVFSVSDTQSYSAGTKVKVFYDPEDRRAVAIVGVAD